jgi:glycosyltransferase involved in cell wall biosynthesis
MKLLNIFKKKPFVSILMLVHNAPEYTEISIRTVKTMTHDVDYELIVLDNESDQETKELLAKLNDEGLIDKLKFNSYNSFFAEGNNIASKMSDHRTTHYLLLNSDIEIKDDKWLSHLLSVHKKGETSYGVVHDPVRVDGYCLLIDKEAYDRFPLDEGHQWWWSTSKQTAALLNDGYSVQAIEEHERWIHHFGGKSGDAYKKAKGMGVSREDVLSWFAGKEGKIIR